jgi:cation diffusion facilitator CzcD-associated flavoprotein CzcO
MRAHPEDKVGHAVDAWLGRLNAALAAPDANNIGALFAPDGHWRDLLALTWRFGTLSGRDALAPALARALAGSGAREFAIDTRRCAPRVVERAGTPCVEAFLRFETNVGHGEGLLRMRRDDKAKARAAPVAWTLLTALDELRGCEESALRVQREEPVIARDFHGPNWLDRRRAALDYSERDPTVLIVGGGHAGLTLAARLGQLDVDALVVDRMQRIGDNWRRRYRGLKLHNQVHSNHLPYLPFPPTFPAYLAKDQIANWLETYAECMDIAFWTQTAFEGATFDAAEGRWSTRVTRADGATRTLRPKHIVMATSVSGTPHIPQIPTLERFAGTVVHSSKFTDGAAWRGRPVMVIGTGTSAHDIAQDLHGHGARVTMVQRSPTLVVNVEPSAQLYDGVYLGEGPSLEDRDLINASIPLPLTKIAHRLLTDEVKAIDRPLLDGLEKAGFRLSFGEDGTGWPLLYRTRGGGYYFNVGCSELIASGEIGIVQYHDIESFIHDGARMEDGRKLKAELIVLATGYKGQDHLVETLFGAAVAARVGPIWGFDERSQELRNMWARTGQPGLWFTAGAFSQCRIYSKLLALQIKAAELGLLRDELSTGV